MLSTALTAVLALLTQISPLATSSTISSIINALIQLLPIIVKEVQDLVPVVKNIIAALRSNGEITQEQMDQLDAMEQTYDTEFDKAAAAAEAEDAAVSSQT